MHLKHPPWTLLIPSLLTYRWGRDWGACCLFHGSDSIWTLAVPSHDWWSFNLCSGPVMVSLAAQICESSLLWEAESKIASSLGALSLTSVSHFKILESFELISGQWTCILFECLPSSFIPLVSKHLAQLRNLGLTERKQNKHPKAYLLSWKSDVCTPGGAI